MVENFVKIVENATKIAITVSKMLKILKVVVWKFCENRWKYKNFKNRSIKPKNSQKLSKIFIKNIVKVVESCWTCNRNNQKHSKKPKNSQNLSKIFIKII